MIIACIIYIVLFFPFSVNIYAIYLNKVKKLCFSLHLYRIIALFGGYIVPSNDGFILHYSKYKAKIIPYKSILSINKTIEPVKDFHVLNFNSLIEIGQDNVLKSMEIAFTINYVLSLITSYYKVNKPYLKINNNVCVYENEEKLNIYLNTKIIFNLFMIIFSIIKTLWGKLSEKRNKRYKNKQCN